MKKFRKMQYSVKKNGDTTVQLDEYWVKADKLAEEERKEKKEEISQVYIRFEEQEQRLDYIKHKTDTKVTYHRLHDFYSLFEQNNLSMGLLDKSLNPVFNTE